MATPEAIRSGAACLQALENVGGLDARYDAALIDDLIVALGFDPSKSLRAQLAADVVSVERFIDAFFIAAAPYAAMMTELLCFFEAAKATASSSGTLRIAFDFGHKIEGLDFDLESFAVWERRFIEGRDLVMRDEVAWNHDYLVELCAMVERSAPAGRAGYPPSVDEWLRAYDEGGVIPEPNVSRPFAAGGDPFDLVWNVWLRIVDESRERSVSRAGLRAFEWRPDIAADDDSWLFRLLDGASWAGRMLRAMFSIASDAAALHAMSETVTKLVSEMPRRRTTTARRIEAFESFLSLPVWQRRHELYSAWVGARIAADVPGRSRIHSRGGVIRYSFRGSHLATFERKDGDALYLWAELRSPLVRPKGRGRAAAIQPDYSVQREPITYGESSALVVECKQYLKASRKGFVAALDDYARGRPTAHVVLVNYGPADEALRDALDADLRDRTSVIGHFRPGSPDALARFADVVGSALAETPVIRMHDPVAASIADGAVRITLTWPAGPRDLDLHAWIRFEGEPWVQLSYRNRGRLDAHPWTQLDHDWQEASGTETLTFLRPCLVRCAVHNYSNEISLAASSAEIRVEHDGAEFIVACPEHGSGEWWNAIEIDLYERRIRVINRLQSDISDIATGESDAESML